MCWGPLWSLTGTGGMTAHVGRLWEMVPVSLFDKEQD